MIKYCIAGKNDIAVNALHYMLNELKINKSEITVITNTTDKGFDSWQKSLKKYANNVGIIVSDLEQIYNIENLLFVSLEFDKIIKTEKFKTNRLFNIHFSNLPKYKGMYTSVMPILNGENIGGVTLHKINNGIDTGDIIDQILFDIDITDTAHDLYFKYLKNSFELFKVNVVKLINEDYKSKKQTNLYSSYYSKQEIDFKNIQIDLNKTSFEIYNQIRAFIFPEYQLPKINNKPIISVEFTDEFVGYKKLEIKDKQIIISGIDGYKIIANYQDNFIGRNK